MVSFFIIGFVSGIVLGALLTKLILLNTLCTSYNNPVQRARKRKSDMLFNDPLAFESQLIDEINKLQVKAFLAGKKLALRLNGGSDLDWTHVYEGFPLVQFWEYTKRPELAIKLSTMHNVHVTYSYNERTSSRILQSILLSNVNIAKVFNIRKGMPLPADVIDGDLHDYRFLDPRGVIVGLRLKSLRRITDTKLAGGFVQS
jgi:hypothetical protein